MTGCFTSVKTRQQFYMASPAVELNAVRRNHFELRLTQVVSHPSGNPAGRTPPELCLGAEVWVDGVLLDEPHAVSVGDVLRSFAKQGARSWAGSWHYVFTCGCGNAACANIEEGIGAVHEADAVDWVFRRPQANRFGGDVLGFKKWCETATWHRYSFDRHQATRELVRFMDEVWKVVNTATMEIADRTNVLFWFNDDPRYGMRYRSDESWTEQVSGMPIAPSHFNEK